MRSDGTNPFEDVLQGHARRTRVLNANKEARFWVLGGRAEGITSITPPGMQN